MQVDHDGGAVFYNEHSMVVFCAALALQGLYGLWVGTRHYGWRALMPRLDTDLPSQAAEDEALGCVKSDPSREWPPEVKFLAGRAALRREVAR